MRFITVNHAKNGKKGRHEFNKKRTAVRPTRKNRTKSTIYSGGFRKNVNFEEVTLASHEIKGRFDYIMAPGIYSWISTEARRRLLEQVEIALTDNGLAYFSYNTYPGWNTPPKP